MERDDYGPIFLAQKTVASSAVRLDTLTLSMYHLVRIFFLKKKTGFSSYMDGQYLLTLAERE